MDGMSLAGLSNDLRDHTDRLYALEQHVTALAKNSESDDLRDLATRLVDRLYTARRALQDRGPGSANGELETASHLVARIDLLLVGQAPIADPGDPAWDVLLAWRDAAARCGSMLEAK
jgi:hypothetical protein